MEVTRLKAIELAKRQVAALNLDLKNLVVLTECASKSYGLTPLIALMAGAKVYAVGKDSLYGLFEQNKSAIIEMINFVGLDGAQIEFYNGSVPHKVWNKANIVTNSGFLRPFTADKIEYINPKGVITLMWETWELRDGEIDIAACQNAKIPVIGTNEHFPKADMYGYPGMLAIKLLLGSGLDIVSNKIVLLGGGLTGRLIARTFSDLNIDFLWFTNDGLEKEYPNFCYGKLNMILELDYLDAILCADHVSKNEIIGKDSIISFSDIKQKFPNVEWCHLTGPVNVDLLNQSGINFFPKTIKPVGFMSYETDNLGWGPVVILNSAGLKVGEIAARARLENDSVENAIQKTIDYGIGQDFEGGFLNFKHGK